jgi:hypothetical protein
MAEYVVVVRVDEGTMGHIGDNLFQNHSFCWVVGLFHCIFEEWIICIIHSLHMKSIPCGLMCVTIRSNDRIYLLNLLQNI